MNEYQTAGGHEVRFDASHLSSGMYLYGLEAAGRPIVQKMLLARESRKLSGDKIVSGSGNSLPAVRSDFVEWYHASDIF